MKTLILILVVCLATILMTGCLATKKQDLCSKGGTANSYWTSESFPKIEGAEFCRELVKGTDDDFVEFVVYNDNRSYSVDYLKPLEENMKTKGWIIEKVSTKPELNLVQMHASNLTYGRMFVAISPCSKQGFMYMKCFTISFSSDP